jgi:BlaI family penicillinase repressor
MKKKKPQTAAPGDLQLAVMNVLWSRPGATLAEIRSVLEADRSIATTTIATVLGRLESAGVIEHDGVDRSRTYRAVAPRSEMQKTQTRRLIDRFFGGQPSELVSHLVRESEVTGDDLARLRRLLRKPKRS